MKDFNYEVLKEQEQVLKMLANKVGLKVDDGDYVRRFCSYCLGKTYDEKFINELSKLIGEYIKEGKLNNWVKENIDSHSIEELIDIKFFWESYISKLNILGKGEPVSYTDDELAKLDEISAELGMYGGFTLEYSSACYNEPLDENDDGESIFTYTDKMRYI